MIIGIDIDDTISDTCEVMINYAQEYTINVLKREPILDQDKKCTNHFYIRDLFNWTEKQDNEFLDMYYEKILKNVKPKTLAREYLNKLYEEGNKIVLITARVESDYFDVRKATEDWIKANNIPCDKLIINAEDKLIVAKEENVEIFIDDSFSNCKMVSSGGIKTYIMDSRTNNGLKDENIERIYSWPHLYMKLKR